MAPKKCYVMREIESQVTGYVTNEQLAELYRRASIFAFPSLDEGFGMPVLKRWRTECR